MQAGLNLRIKFQFQDFQDFDWVFVSEVRFCTDPQTTFQLTQSDISFTIIQPS